MKNLFILTGLFLSFTVSLWSASLSSREITNMISKIKEEREGIAISKLESTVTPFHLNKKKVVEVIDDEGQVKELPKETEYTLKAILNHAAFINTKWYKQGDKLGIYRIGTIGRSSVILKSKNGNKTLFIKKKKKIFMKLN